MSDPRVELRTAATRPSRALRELRSGLAEVPADELVGDGGSVAALRADCLIEAVPEVLGDSSYTALLLLVLVGHYRSVQGGLPPVKSRAILGW